MKTNKEKYPTQRYVKFEKVVREKVEAGYYHIPEACNRPDYLYDTIVELTDIERETQEVFGVISLNNRMKVMACSIVHKGTVNASLVSTRDVFKEALTAGAVAIAIFHNHPSGDPFRSDEDLSATERIKEAGKIMDIELIDHIIIGDGKYYSLRENFEL